MGQIWLFARYGWFLLDHPQIIRRKSRHFPLKPQTEQFTTVMNIKHQPHMCVRGLLKKKCSHRKCKRIWDLVLELCNSYFKRFDIFEKRTKIHILIILVLYLLSPRTMHEGDESPNHALAGRMYIIVIFHNRGWGGAANCVFIKWGLLYGEAKEN